MPGRSAPELRTPLTSRRASSVAAAATASSATTAQPMPIHIISQNRSGVLAAGDGEVDASSPSGISIAASLPNNAASVSENAVARNQVPIIRLTTRGTDNCVTADRPTGDRHISPISSTR